MKNKQIIVEFTFDDDHGGIYDVKATLEVRPDGTVSILQVYGAEDQDGGEQDWLKRQLREEIMEHAFGPKRKASK